MKKRLIIGLLLIAGLIGLTAFFKSGSEETSGAYHTVARGNLTVSVIEGGSIEAVNEVVVKNTIDGESRIISLIAEGTYVKKGDLLVEFDRGQAESSVQEKQVKYESRQAEVVKATNDLIITNSTVESEVSAAELEVKFAVMDLEKFEKLEREHKVRSADLKIDTEEEALKIAQRRFEWSEKLAAKGFETKSTVDRDRLEVSKSSKAVETAKSERAMLKTFDLQKSAAKLLSAQREAESKLVRVQKQGESKVTQKQAAVNSAKSTLRLTKETLERAKEQLAATKLYAPQDGLVIYAKSKRYWDNEPAIAEGSKIRNRRDVIKIPDVSKLKVEVKIHESMISQIKKGQKVFIVLDSLPDERFLGEVTKVALLPDSGRGWRQQEKKVYTTEITISEEMKGIKPGVSARAEIIIDDLKDIIFVPIQAVTTLDEKQVCYLKGSDEPVEVKVGLFNTKFIEIKSGLKAGDEVNLSPPLDDRVNLTCAPCAGSISPLPRALSWPSWDRPARENPPSLTSSGASTAPAQGNIFSVRMRWHRWMMTPSLACAESASVSFSNPTTSSPSSP